MREILIPMNRAEGDRLPVSVFAKYADGVMPTDTARFEKRGVADNVPVWDADKCIGCNRCALVCPHAAIRPFLFTEEEAAAAPAGCETKRAAGKGFDVIMTPNEYCYYNFAQSEDLDGEPLAQNRSPKSSITLEKAYGYDPLDGIPDGAQDRVLGVQANMWTEYIAEPEHLEYMFFPRLLAMSEVQWCRPSVKDYDRFKASALGRHIEILDFLGYNHK